MCVYRQLPHAPENPIALLSLTERRAINLTWARAFDGNSPLIRYILEVSENSESFRPASPFDDRRSRPSPQRRHFFFCVSHSR